MLKTVDRASIFSPSQPDLRACRNIWMRSRSIKKNKQKTSSWLKRSSENRALTWQLSGQWQREGKPSRRGDNKSTTSATGFTPQTETKTETPIDPEKRAWTGKEERKLYLTNLLLKEGNPIPQGYKSWYTVRLSRIEIGTSFTAPRKAVFRGKKEDVQENIVQGMHPGSVINQDTCALKLEVHRRFRSTCVGLAIKQDKKKVAGRLDPPQGAGPGHPGFPDIYIRYSGVHHFI